jgi:hypothetical protein
MGFLVTQPTALAQAGTLGLKNASGGISHLLDNNYGTTGVASGVGIRIYKAGESTPLTLLSTNTATGTGNAAGWYGFADLMSPQVQVAMNIADYSPPLLRSFRDYQ